MNVMVNPRAAVPHYTRETFVYLDIETLPCQDAAFRDVVKARIKPPANIKKAESIEAWLSENLETATDEAVSRTSFEGGRGHVCTIAWAKNDGAIRSRHARTLAEEADVIRAFFGDLDEYHAETIVGHNVADFDLRFLMKRAVVLGVELPSPAALPRDIKPWSKGIADTMLMWSGAKDRVSMNDLCDMLGIAGKDGFDGSMVAAAWAEGQHDTIEEYCRDDVHRTREIHKRFLMAGW